MSGIDELREHYDTTDQSTALDDAVAETDSSDELLVSTSIRLSKKTLDQVRSLAASTGVPATTLMREWIEARVSGTEDAMVVSVADLEKLISTTAHPVN